ncbi:GerAB/ArcD/ProY family transporter [Clostridium rectalis]|uniref:GerAB/ArcD/ProY family transporter n=1 Tax=Clostridium rectalis TaxID=2040295 RepID=UPI000F63BC14|nr:GerAB/ArcD/ProY family transporter [Clostridium rectalis]
MKEYISNRQLAFYLFSAIVGYGIIGLPKALTEASGTAAWITIILATTLALFITYIILYINYTFKNKTFDEYINIITNKSIGKILILVYIIYFYTFSVLSIRNTGEIIKANFLVKTPQWIIFLLLISICTYTANKGLSVIARMCELYGVFIILFTFITHIIMFFNGKLINIQPILGFRNIFSYIKDIPKAIMPFLGMELLLIIPLNKKNEKKQLFKYSSYMMIIIGLLYILIVESTLSIIGLDDIIHYEDALIAAIRRVDITYLDFFGRVDGISLITWLMSVYTTATIYTYASGFLTQRLLKIKNCRIIYVLLFMLSIPLNTLIKTSFEIDKLLRFSEYLGIFCSVVIPFIIFIVIKVEKYDKKYK